jgi:hypothetical protein
MSDVDFAALQQIYGGRYVAHRGGEVIASAESDAELHELLDESLTDWSGVVVEYVEPIDAIRVY